MLKFNKLILLSLRKYGKKFFSAENKLDTVVYNKHSKYLTEIVLNNPKTLNALDLKMIKNLLKTCRKWLPENESQELIENAREENKIFKKDEDVPKVIIMTGAGPKAFCAGGDVVSIYNLKKMNKEIQEVCEFFKYEYLTDFIIAKMKPIQISFWNGFVMGGGVGVSINAPIRIATENTQFAMPETKIGLIPDVGATYFLPRIFNNNTNIGLFYGLTGERLKGKELVKCGLATHYVTLDKFDLLKKKIIEITDENINYLKINQLCNSYSEIVYKDNDFSVNNLEEIKNVFQHDNLHNIFSRLTDLVEKGNEDNKNWAAAILKNLNSYSPISMILHFEQMKRGMKIKTLEEAFELELRLIYKILEGNEFTEGVRSLLIEKDMKPIWKYKSINEINEKELIAEYFGN